MIAEDIHHQGTVFKDLDSPFSINEFNLALSQSRKNFSPNLDQVNYVILCSALSAKYNITEFIQLLFTGGNYIILLELSSSLFRKRIILVSALSHFYHVPSKSLRRLSI